MTTRLAPLRHTASMKLFMLLFFTGSTLLLMPLTLFVFDNDEGINLMKAVLMADGYSLYTQTWSDQPPIFTQLLEWTFALFRSPLLPAWLHLEPIIGARLLVLTLAILFVWAYISTIELTLGLTGAWIGLLLLMLSDNFLRMSVSVMIGLPALSFAMVAIYLLQRYKARPAPWLLIAAGCLMALSMQTKFYTAVIGPVLCLDLLDFGRGWSQERRRFGQQLRALLLWGGVTLVVYLALGFYYGAFDLGMLFGAHLNANVQEAYAEDGGFLAVLRYLLFDYGHLTLAALGVGIIWARGLRAGLLPLGWFVVALILLSNHRPLWYHHYQLLAIPLCWLGAYLALPFADNVRSWRLIVPTVAVVLALIYWRGERTVPYYNQRDYDQNLVALLTAEAANTEWVFADQAIYPFYAGLRVPPELAVFSRKRFFGATLSNQILLDVLARYQPEQVLLTRFKDELLADPAFAAYLDSHYTKAQETGDYVYYQVR